MEETNTDKNKNDSNPVVEKKAEATGKGNMKKLWIIIGALILLVAVGLIFAVPYFKDSPNVSGNGKDGTDSKAESSETQHTSVKATFALEPFLVNLADKEEVRFVKISFHLGLAEELKAEGMEIIVPAIKDSIITLLTSKTSEEILTPQGKVNLREQIKTRINELAPEMKVVKVYIVEFVVQL